MSTVSTLSTVSTVETVPDRIKMLQKPKTSAEIRQAFLDFFKEKDHHIIPPAPMVVRNDPTLMFTNAGMNQFKDIFLGNVKPEFKRVADAQKCLRVSGKHNDLEEVGLDTYHHTMFEMLGNWSFGDYFKQEAIEWAWEFLTSSMGIPEDRLYATVFEGDPQDKVDMDAEAFRTWNRFLDEGRVLKGSKKDNFWEMGDTGPCGPSSEIHVDLREEKERKKIPGNKLINAGHPLVMEIWNLVFIQYNRRKNGSLEKLPKKHVDTGLGFERLCMVLQNKRSNYDTDLFMPMIRKISEITGISYGSDKKKDIAFRVLSDHIRAIAFSIADGQIPSNTKAGYVIRRILRRAIRYGFTYLGLKEAFLHKLVPELVKTMGDAYPEILAQQETISKVIREEETTFLRTLDKGINLLNEVISKRPEDQTRISGKTAFELYDTYGFPVDLTDLILREKGLSVDMDSYRKEMEEQKARSKSAARKDEGEWTVLIPEQETRFVAYDRTEDHVKISRYRKVKTRDKEYYQVVLDTTPFYAESGGQVGDTGWFIQGDRKIEVFDTQKENNMILHYAGSLPDHPEQELTALVDADRRRRTMNNHSATHLMHDALRRILGEHVEQKGSLVHPGYLRFDFSHFSKLSDQEIKKIEEDVNRNIWADYPLEEHRDIPMEEARDMGALAFFGEKYGSRVRVVRFGDSTELCAGTHVPSTGQIGMFKILRESAIAAGIRRIEAITNEGVWKYLLELEDERETIAELTRAQGDNVQTIRRLLDELDQLRKEKDQLLSKGVDELKKELLDTAREVDSTRVIIQEIKSLKNPEKIKDLAFQLNREQDNIALLLAFENSGKAMIYLMFSGSLLKKGFHAGRMIKEIAKEVQGGGGGQAFFATAGGKDPSGIDKALEIGKKLIMEKLGSSLVP